MQEPAIQWGAIAVFGSIVIGSLLINLGLRWREHQRRRLARGFRNMRSLGGQQRERMRRSPWQQQPASRRKAGQAGGWR